MDSLIINKRITDGTNKNPDKTITSLSDVELGNEEVSLRKLGLKHGLLIRPKESEMITIMDDTYNKIVRQNVMKDDNISKHRIQTALKSFTYTCLDLDFKIFGIDQKRIRILRNLRNRCMILKPYKGQGIVINNKKDYFQSLDRLLNDKTKFEILEEDPTLRNLNTIQNYLNTLYKRGEITEDEKKLMRPKFGQVGRAHGLPKIPKQFNNIPSLRPIIDTTNTPHYNVDKYLANLLNPLTQNDFVVKDSFEAVNKIHNIPPELFNCGYRYY